MRIGYIGIDLFYPALETLSNLGCKIEKIFTCETDNVTEFNLKVVDFAKRNDIPYTLKRITREDILEMKKDGVDCAICAGYYYKIPADCDFPIVNIHPSLLPVGRGSWPMPQAILSGIKKSGVTIHKIDEGFDTGDILLQREFLLGDTETLVSFMNKVYDLLPQMLERLMADFDSLYIGAKTQGEGEYWEAPTEKDWSITPDMAAEKADLILRAFLGYECLYKTNNEKHRIIGGRVVFGEDPNANFTVQGGYIKGAKVLD